MSLFVLRGLFCVALQGHSVLFLAQQPTTQPLSVPQCQWEWESGHSLSGHKCSHLQACGNTGTLYFQTTVVCEREVGCAKAFMRRVRTLLNRALLVSPYSEVTLSLQSASQMKWVLCQRQWSSFVECESECEATLLVECPLTIVLDQSLYSQMGQCTLHTLRVDTNYDAPLVHLVQELGFY